MGRLSVEQLRKHTGFDSLARHMDVSGFLDYEPDERVQAVATVLLPLARYAEPLDMNAHLVAEHYAYAVLHALDARTLGA